jgi:DNA-binding transcriptional MerR regulator
MRIGELAQRTGVSTCSLRYHEQQGLLCFTRTSGGHREYSDDAVHRVTRIQHLYAAGLHSSRIKQLLPCIMDEDGTPADTADGQLLVDLSAERDRIDRSLADLARSKALLDETIKTASAQLHARTESTDKPE